MKLYIYSLQRKQYTGIYDVGSLGHLGNLVDLGNPDYCHLLIHVFFYHNIKFFRLYNANFPIHKTSTCKMLLGKFKWHSTLCYYFPPIEVKITSCGIIDGSWNH